MRKLVIFLCFLASSTYGFAQTKPVPQDATISAVSFWNYSKCAAESAPERIRALLEHFPWTSADFEAARKFAVGRSNCLMPDDSLSFRSDVLQGAFSSVLLVRKYSGGAFPDFAQLPFAFGPEELADLEGDARKRYISLAFGECVFRTNTAATISVLSAEPFSAAETIAFSNLGPAMSACLPLQPGDQVKFTRPALRNFLAIAGYESDKRVPANPSGGVR